MTGKKESFSFSSLLPHVGALVAICGWGLSFVSTRIIMDGGVVPSPSNVTISPTEAYLYRFVMAYFVLLVFSHRRMLADNWKDECMLMLCGLSSGSIYFIAENTALELTNVSNVSLLSSTSPLVTVLLLGILYKSERPGKGLVIGSLIAFAGVGCVVLSSAASIDVRPAGDLLAFATAFSWAFYSLIVKRLNVIYDAVFITRKTFFYGVVTALPFLLFEPSVRNPFTVVVEGWPWVDVNLVFLILFPSVLSFYLWTLTIKRLGPVVSNNYMYLQPVVTVVASSLILHERISILGYTGFALILFGLWLGYFLQERVFRHMPGRV